MFLSSRKKEFIAGANYIKEIYFDKETFLTARDKMFSCS